ncbi:MAG TPA: lactonase family protein [Candidatus Limnocylindria bacterium]|jgi:6-phosphogluconolactonase|nr:lactonase family protein [Candidatus Limnocylindria bacterium]
MAVLASPRGVNLLPSRATLVALAFVGTSLVAEQYRLYIGTYTGPKSDGIYAATFDSETGALGDPKLVAKTANPTFIAIDPAQGHLYAANEVGQWGKQKGGYLTAFAIDPANGDLKELNQQSSVGSGPCHIIVDEAGKYALAANYGSGSFVALPINKDGSLQANTFFSQFKGSSVNKSRQGEPHAHSTFFSPDNKLAFVCDLGTDKIHAFDFDSTNGVRSAHEALDGIVPAGSGPRHSAFSPDGHHLYVINELLSTITVFGYDATSQKLSEIENVKTLPADFTGESWTAEVRVHPSGKFVYGSNRGHDSIAVFTRDAVTGKLTPVGQTKTGGKTPRNFNLDPSGKFLLAGNQGTDNITEFRIDENTGTLTKMDRELKVGAPVCLRFVLVK